MIKNILYLPRIVLKGHEVLFINKEMEFSVVKYCI